MTILRISASFLIVWLTLLSGCTRLPPTAQTTLKPESVAELQKYLLDHKPNVDQFRLRGPFVVTTQSGHEIRLSGSERFNTDLFLSSPDEKAPLVIFLHGYDSTKEAHANQAMHLASWGMHCLTLQLPAKGAWVSNGRTLARIVRFLHRTPEAVDRRVDVSKIILVGHSFGASAVASALGEGAPAAGAILLDPAGIGQNLPKFLQQIKQPVMVLGADEEVSSARNREYFFKYVRSRIAEVSIKDATHEDAQYPSEYALKNGGFDPYVTEELQITFVSAMTAGALSLASTGSFDYAWTSFGGVFQNGKFFAPKKK